MDWQDISTAPRDGTRFLLWLADEGFAVMSSWRTISDEWSGFWIWEMDLAADDWRNPTHWMPLPEPPKQD